ncbi:DUF3152 domain-containing protein [Actinomadura welshii]|uniref:DUF3152 domain-containing protein n=1 Tax=Actinomadura welshii TaxID=3103817 RepID=UPI0004250621|nr:DUF3152 domain-containing protein [Actinomadura madurae]
MHPTRTRTRRPGRGTPGDLDAEFERARRGRVRGTIAGMLALVLVITAGGALAWYLRPGSDVPGVTSAGSGGGTGGEENHARVETEPSDPPLVKPARPPYVPAKGSGKFARPTSTGKVHGRGKLMRYMVEVEGGLRQDPAAFARSVDDILADPRGWTAGGRWSFKRVSSGPYDFVVKLASPGTVDRICGAYGMTTEGKVNCSAGKQVVVNLKRWLLLTTYYRGQPEHYHALTINHEVGHRLGYGHMTCAGRGRPAPVMQQQIFGLKGCRINGWPYDRKGRFVKGPSVP